MDLIFPAMHVGPNGAVCLFALGTGLIFLEFNRPGRIVPGACGLLLVLLAGHRLAGFPLRGWAVAAALVAAGGLLTNAWRPLPLPVLGMLAAGLGVAVRSLVRPGFAGDIAGATAMVCGGGVGVLAAGLTQIARRARRLKAID